MKSFEEKQKQYAELLVRIGVNIQPGQTLIVKSSLDTAAFARLLAKTAYEAGAREVLVDWDDDDLRRIRLLHAPDEAMDDFPQWIAKGYEQMAEEGAALLQIYAPNPDLLKDADPVRVGRVTKARALAFQTFNTYTRTAKISWLIASVPTPDWAAKLFPELGTEAAIAKLWEAIFQMNRVNEADPVEAWKRHIAHLNERRVALNEQAFAKLHLRAPGTDLTVALPAEHQWVCAEQLNAKGVTFVPNLPTEELFSMPAKLGVEGTVSSTKPLNHGGRVIDGFSLTFREGRIVDYKAETGYDTLQQLIETDEGSHYLGEIALVPDESPISQSNIVFFNTLYDENASCHLAIGSALPFCLKGGTEMSQEELAERGANKSLIHVDFMIGSAEMDIDGVKTDGTRVPLFRQGSWV
ncbi:aminopeptidase [Paenibacillus sp. HJGM_3]|uniref:aminopeptidase n=1 Tax=Paenibacillus sp. HJGM_3 TaxID=3379816 RepID=UPI00385A0C8D